MSVGNWRFKPSGKLPVFMRFIINSSFTKENAKKSDINTPLPNRTFVNHIMFWKAEEYDPFEKEILDHLKADDGWFEKYCRQQLAKSEYFYKKGLDLKKVDWPKKSNEEIAREIKIVVQESRELACAWYAQYPLDEFFESAVEEKLKERISPTDHDFRKCVLIFTDPAAMTDVSEERLKLLEIVKSFIQKKENFNHFSPEAEEAVKKHLEKYAYINCGLATSPAYTFEDIAGRLREIQDTTSAESVKIDHMIYDTSEQKVIDDYKWALDKIKPDEDFLEVINKARQHSYVRNRRVEAFFNIVYGMGFCYAEVARRLKFNPDWIMEVSVPEMLEALLKGAKLPEDKEIKRRLKDYAMLVRNSVTTLVTDPVEIEKLKKEYVITTEEKRELRGNVACLGGIIRGRAKVCLDKSEIGKVNRGDILVANFTTPDFVPAMEKVVAIVADQGGLSSHAAIVSRELGVPCVIATQDGTRIIKDNDLLEVNARTGVVKIIERG